LGSSSSTNPRATAHTCAPAGNPADRSGSPTAAGSALIGATLYSIALQKLNDRQIGIAQPPRNSQRSVEEAVVGDNCPIAPDDRHNVPVSQHRIGLPLPPDDRPRTRRFRRLDAYRCLTRQVFHINPRNWRWD
jgi:hypothetical protein